MGWMIVVGVPAPAAVRRARLRQARGRPGALRHGQRAVHLHLGELLAHDPPGDDVVPTLPVAMGLPLWFCVACFLLLFVLLLRLRVRLEEQRARLDALYLSLDE